MRLAVLGASARAAAFSALDAGFEVVACDLFADSDLAARCRAAKIANWPGDFEPWLKAQDVDGWLYTGGLENHAELVERLARVHPLLGNRGDVLLRCCDPKFLAQSLANAGLRQPAICSLPPNDNGRWLIKSPASAGGLGVRVWNQGDPVAPGDYWQQRIDGRAMSAAYVAADGRVELLGITEQLIGRAWTAARPFQYAGSVGPLAVDTGVRNALRLVGETVASTCNLVGLFGVDFVLDRQQVAWAIEVNPRYIASLEVIERSTGANAIAAHVAACMDSLVESCTLPTSKASYGKAYLFARQDVVVSLLSGPKLCDIPSPGTVVPAGGPICTVLAEADRFESVEPELITVAARVERELTVVQEA